MENVSLLKTAAPSDHILQSWEKEYNSAFYLHDAQCLQLGEQLWEIILIKKLEVWKQIHFDSIQ